MWGRAAAQTVERAFPGTTPLALWILATVPAPLIAYELTHRWEEDQDIFNALQWTVPAVPVIAAVSARRWTGPHAPAGAAPSAPSSPPPPPER